MVPHPVFIMYYLCIHLPLARTFKAHVPDDYLPILCIKYETYNHNNDLFFSFLKLIVLTKEYSYVYTGCSLNIVFFLKIVIFLNFVSSSAALVFYLPGVCVHTH